MSGVGWRREDVVKDDTDVLRATHLAKRFSSTLALDDVSFTLRAGQVVALAGENGAGKSTLVQILAGALSPDGGEISIRGESLGFKDVSDAIGHGVSTVFQELSLVGSLSVAENIFPGRQPTRAGGIVRWKKMRDDAANLMQDFGVRFDPEELVRNLSVGQQQMLEILKAVSIGPQVLILDEPTSSLGEADVDVLLHLIRRLRDDGVAVLFITHRLAEIFAVCDRALILRDGRLIQDTDLDGVTETELVRWMIGREIQDIYPYVPAQARRGFDAAKTVLEVTGLSGVSYSDVSFTVNAGEIVGFAGLIGAGRTEVARGIVRADPVTAGTIRLNGAKTRFTDVRGAIDAGIGYLTEDRKGLGLYLSMGIDDNLVANTLRSVANRLGILSPVLRRRNALEQIASYRIVASSGGQRVGDLSGGNQQKVLLSEWMSAEPSVLFLDEPTRGVDIGARAEIYEKIMSFAAEGHAVVIISSELAELIGMCDRILVMRSGALVGELTREEFTEESIMTLATGVGRQQ